MIINIGSFEVTYPYRTLGNSTRKDVFVKQIQEGSIWLSVKSDSFNAFLGTETYEVKGSHITYHDTILWTRDRTRIVFPMRIVFQMFRRSHRLKLSDNGCKWIKAISILHAVLNNPNVYRWKYVLSIFFSAFIFNCYLIRF